MDSNLILDQRSQNRPRFCFRHAVILIFMVAALFSSTSVIADPPQHPIAVVPIGNPQNTLSIGTLRTLFGMRLRSWPNGTPVTVLVLADKQPIHIAFSKQVLGIFPHQLRWAWDRLVYSGTGQAPRQVASEAQMLQLLENTPGAIGYLSHIPANAKVKVKPIRIR